MTQHGVVAAFDEDEGIGEVTSDEGERFRFHCVQIADGSRTIAVGAGVTFATIAKLGTVEAAWIETRRSAE